MKQKNVFFTNLFALKLTKTIILCLPQCESRPIYSMYISYMYLNNYKKITKTDMLMLCNMRFHYFSKFSSPLYLYINTFATHTFTDIKIHLL